MLVQTLLKSSRKTFPGSEDFLIGAVLPKLGEATAFLEMR